jgi:hypothetical protein
VTHDDAIRELHGVNTHQPDANWAGEIILDERDGMIDLRLSSNRSKAHLTPWQARYLARKIWRLARRIEARTQQENT